ncbi:hypothetical protein [Halomonas sp. hl-4]|uniref:hypothetical protein n=1 Tax=Halomonas sp. hl-4 TaxID=1761789 RepID=UPI000BB8D231|nr:hypothetical protein [Halomonas sp. hl-4]SNY97730.1 hypothetical protein SAMN04488142_2335 [Halomonas sp. hl-4]
MQKMATRSLDEAWTLSVNLLEGHGCAAAHVEVIASSVAAQRDECHSHGLYRLIKQGARLPSQRRHEARHLSQLEGVEIPAELHEELTKLLNAVAQ